MNRIFHKRITWSDYLYLLILGGTAFHFLWIKQIILAVIVMILLLILVERIIHTTYTITSDKQLILFFGRFSKFKPIPIEAIQEVKRIEKLKIGKFYLRSYLLLKIPSGEIGITPVKEREMVDGLLKVNPYIKIN